MKNFINLSKIKSYKYFKQAAILSLVGIFVLILVVVQVILNSNFLVQNKAAVTTSAFVNTCGVAIQYTPIDKNAVTNDIMIYDLPAGTSNVSVAVWSNYIPSGKSNSQDDLNWYQATKKNELGLTGDVYFVSVPIINIKIGSNPTPLSSEPVFVHTYINNTSVNCNQSSFNVVDEKLTQTTPFPTSVCINNSGTPTPIPTNTVVPTLTQAPITPTTLPVSNLSLNATATASSTYPAGGTPSSIALPKNAIDGDLNTAWNAGGKPTTSIAKWILIDLGAGVDKQFDITKIHLVTDQDPSGITNHDIYAGSLDTLTKVANFNSNTSANMSLDKDFSLNPLKGVRYIKIQTTVSPSYVAWKEIEIYGKQSNLTKISTNISATASKSVNGGLPQNAVDGDINTMWNAGATSSPTNQWLELNLGEVHNVKKIRLRVSSATTPLNVVHKIYGGKTSNPSTLLGTISQSVVDKNWIDVYIPYSDVQYIRIVTENSSTSWVSWFEVEPYE